MGSCEGKKGPVWKTALCGQKTPSGHTVSVYPEGGQIHHVVTQPDGSKESLSLPVAARVADPDLDPAGYKAVLVENAAIAREFYRQTTGREAPFGDEGSIGAAAVTVTPADLLRRAVPAAPAAAVSPDGAQATIAGVPVPMLAIGAAVALLLILRR